MSLPDGGSNFGKQALDRLLGSSSGSGSAAPRWKHEAIPTQNYPNGARYCIAIAGMPAQVSEFLAAESRSNDFTVSKATESEVVVHAGVLVDYAYRFQLVPTSRGTDVFLFFGEPKLGWGPVQVLNLQRNITNLTRALELNASRRGLDVSGPSNWIRPLYSGAGGYAMKAAGATAQNALLGCFGAGITLVLIFIVGGIWISSQRDRRFDSTRTSADNRALLEGNEDTTPASVLAQYNLYTRVGRSWTIRFTSKLPSGKYATLKMKTSVVRVASGYAEILTESWDYLDDKLQSHPDPRTTRVEFVQTPKKETWGPIRSEAVDAAGLTWQCDYFEHQKEGITTRSWISQRFPGLLVKTTTIKDGSEVEEPGWELIDFSE